MSGPAWAVRVRAARDVRSDRIRQEPGRAGDSEARAQSPAAAHRARAAAPGPLGAGAAFSRPKTTSPSRGQAAPSLTVRPPAVLLARITAFGLVAVTACGWRGGGGVEGGMDWPGPALRAGWTRVCGGGGEGKGGLMDRSCSASPPILLGTPARMARVCVCVCVCVRARARARGCVGAWVWVWVGGGRVRGWV